MSLLHCGSAPNPESSMAVAVVTLLSPIVTLGRRNTLTGAWAQQHCRCVGPSAALCLPVRVGVRVRVRVRARSKVRAGVRVRVRVTRQMTTCNMNSGFLRFKMSLFCGLPQMLDVSDRYSHKMCAAGLQQPLWAARRRPLPTQCLLQWLYCRSYCG